MVELRTSFFVKIACRGCPVMQLRCGWLLANFFAELALHLTYFLFDDNRANLIFSVDILRLFSSSNQFLHPIETAQLLSFLSDHICILSRERCQQPEQMFPVLRFSFLFLALIVINREGLIIGLGIVMHWKIEGLL